VKKREPPLKMKASKLKVGDRIRIVGVPGQYHENPWSQSRIRHGCTTDEAQLGVGHAREKEKPRNRRKGRKDHGSRRAGTD
jgi:hypothetical protein